MHKDDIRIQKLVLNNAYDQRIISKEEYDNAMTNLQYEEEIVKNKENRKKDEMKIARRKALETIGH
ncbi:hypothetical protein [Salibacterium aidingense]|uniref:hypothetical protein n=1 Tax=Salibacterium aidingense TaxID=384933 RepID=UPI000414E9B7|nr:hypothetical protein [Salibacterium aidingense]